MFMVVSDTCVQWVMGAHRKASQQHSIIWNTKCSYSDIIILSIKASSIFEENITFLKGNIFMGPDLMNVILKI